jgi:hypothetical protein
LAEVNAIYTTHKTMPEQSMTGFADLNREPAKNRLLTKEVSVIFTRHKTLLEQTGPGVFPQEVSGPFTKHNLSTCDPCENIRKRQSLAGYLPYQLGDSGSKPPDWTRTNDMMKSPSITTHEILPEQSTAGMGFRPFSLQLK